MLLSCRAGKVFRSNEAGLVLDSREEALTFPSGVFVSGVDGVVCGDARSSHWGACPPLHCSVELRGAMLCLHSGQSPDAPVGCREEGPAGQDHICHVTQTTYSWFCLTHQAFIDVTSTLSHCGVQFIFIKWSNRQVNLWKKSLKIQTKTVTGSQIQTKDVFKGTKTPAELSPKY